MNTLSLQEKFPEVYKDFYSRNNLVLSWNFSFRLCPGWYWTRSDFASISVKTNLKCFIWFKKIKEKKIIFKDIISYDISNNKFVSEPFSTISKEEKETIMFIKDLYDINEYWVEIHILSETTRWHSFWFFWTFSAILSTGLHLITNEINTQTLLDYDSFVDSDSFNSIFEKWLKIEYLNRYWNTIWQPILSTLKNKVWPSYLLSNKINDIDFSLGDLDMENEYFIDKFSSNLVTSDLPMDMYMVFTWIKTDTKNIESYKLAWEEWLQEIQDYIKNHITDNSNNYLSKFSNKDSINTNLISNLSITSVKAIMALNKVYTSGYSQNLVEDFIDTINQFRFSVSLIEKQSPFAEDFLCEFMKNINNIEEKIWIMPVYSWKMWWWYLVVLKHWISRNTISKTLENLTVKYPNIEEEYNLHSDWESNKWIIIEQSLSDWIYSQYINKTNFIYKNTTWNSYIWTFSDIVSNENKWLLFDMINNKIYLEWIKLTSKDIHSQTTTIEIVTKLLENKWKEVSNKDLLLSSYSKNKNEMVWKIILPFLKLIEKKTWYKLDIVCKWGITYFYLLMNDNNLNIWSIDRI